MIYVYVELTLSDICVYVMFVFSLNYNYDIVLQS